MTDSVGLPRGWARAKLGDVLPIRYGKGLTESKRNAKGDVPVYGSSGVVGTHDEALTRGPALIVGRKGSVGSVHRSSLACWPIDTVYYVEESQDAPLAYYEHLLAHLRLGRLDRSTTIPGLSRDDYDEVVAPIAPLSEQQRIVEAIESYLTRLDNAVALLERVEENLKRYRASVLKAAVEGTLIGGPLAMPTAPLGDLIEGLSQGWSPTCDLTREPTPDEWGIIKTTAVQSMRYLDREAKPLPATSPPRPNLEIKPGDFLMTRKGPRARAGVACLVRRTRPRLMMCDTVYRFRCRKERVDPEYLELALNSPRVVSDIDSKKAGINDSGVSLTHKRLGDVRIPLPPLPHQRVIVAEVGRLLSVAESARQIARGSSSRAAPLRQSILKWAFEGKLSEQDPNDEPASILLERIKAERATAGAPKACRRKKRSTE